MVHWLRRAAARGDADSLYNLAVCYAVRCPSSAHPKSSCIHLPSHLHGCCRRVVAACRGFGIHRMVDAGSHLLHMPRCCVQRVEADAARTQRCSFVCLFVCCLVGLSAASAGCARRHRPSAAFRAACVRFVPQKGIGTAANESIAASHLQSVSTSPPGVPTSTPEYPRVPRSTHSATCPPSCLRRSLPHVRPVWPLEPPRLRPPAQSSSRPLGLFDACGTEPLSCRAAAERGQLDALFALGVQLLSA
jgi:hypothetical protein